MNKYSWLAIPIYTIGYGFGLVITYINALWGNGFTYTIGIGASILGVYISVKVIDKILDKEVIKELNKVRVTKQVQREVENYGR